MESDGTSVETRPVETKQSVANTKRLILTAIKFVISGSLIYWIVRDSNLLEIFMSVRSADIPLLLLAFSLNFVGTYLRAHRWRVLLKAQGVDASIIYLINSTMVSFFFSNFLPSIIGGDTIRVYDSWRVGKSKAGAVTVIFVDRFLGIVALMLLAVSMLSVSKDLTRNLPFLSLWMLLGTSGVLLFLWLIFMPSQQMPKFIAKIRVPFSRKLQSTLEMIINAFLAFQGRNDTLARALGLSLLLQANAVIHYYLIAKALDFPVPFHDFFVIIPLATLIMMIPVSINAIGVRESVFAFFFSTFGLSNSEAITFAWLAYGIILLKGLLGGLVYAFRK